MQILTNILFRTPSDLYESLSSRDAIVKHMNRENLKTSKQVDSYIHNLFRQLRLEIEALESQASLLDPLYIEYDAFKDASRLDASIDQKILKMFSEYNATEAGVVYSKMSIDFYYIEKLLRFQNREVFPQQGYLDLRLITDPSNNIASIIRKSEYYEILDGLSADNAEFKFENAIKNRMLEFLQTGMGTDGVFAKAYFRILEIREIRARMKMIIFGLEESVVSTVYE